MAFLDNAGDIILDAVLTDAGRQRLARGNFKIVKFALGDEEINYGIYNSSHPSGSAFFDLEIMQTPVLEAFTNNTSLMKSKLVSINRNNILYMPILKLNGQSASGCAKFPGFDGYYLLADEKTSSFDSTSGIPTNEPKDGIMHGSAVYANGAKTNYICIDQGIVSDGQTDGLSIADSLPADMIETAFLVRVDHRLLRLHAWSVDGDNNYGPELINQFVDDDAVATYFFAQADGTRTIYGPRSSDANFRGGNRLKLNNPNSGQQFENARDLYEVFKGPIGNTLRIIPKTATSVQFSDTLFDKLGTSVTSGANILAYTGKNITGYKFIDTSINVTGVTTGYSIDIPIRLIKGNTFS